MYRPRFLVLMGLLFIPAIVVLVRLFLLQIVHGAEYRNAQERKVRRIELLPALRGRIVDRTGAPLALDEMLFDLKVIPAEMTDVSRSLREISEVTEIELARLKDRFDFIIASANERASYAVVKEEGVRKVVARGRRDKERALRAEMRTPYELARGLTFEEMSRIATATERFAGVVVSERTRRRYLEGATAAHVVGYVGPLQRPAREDLPGEYERLEQAGYFRAGLSGEIPDDDYETLESRGEFRADVLGRAGIEKAFEAALAGRRGWRIVERDLSTRKETEVYKVPPLPGVDVCLTLDMALQKHVESVLGRAARPAVGIVLSVENSDVLALASTPAYEPGNLQSPVSAETVRSVLQDNAGRPLINRAVSEHYMLGSVFKIATTISALESRTIDPKTEFECRGQFREGVKGFKCWIAAPDIGGNHGVLQLREAMAVSCNIFFLETGSRVGGKNLSSWASLLGFGRVTGIELPGEVPGILPTPSDPIVGQHWSDVDTWNLSIGQGALAVTPLQVAQLLALVGRPRTDSSGVVRFAAPCLVSQLREYPRRDTGWEPTMPAVPSVSRARLRPPWLEPRREQSGQVVWPRNRESSSLQVADSTLLALHEALCAVVDDSDGTAHKSGLAEIGDVAGKTSTAEVSKTGTPAPHAWFAGYYPASAPRFAFVALVVNGGKGSETAAPLAARIVEYLKTMSR